MVLPKNFSRHQKFRVLHERLFSIRFKRTSVYTSSFYCFHVIVKLTYETKTTSFRFIGCKSTGTDKFIANSLKSLFKVSVSSLMSTYFTRYWSWDMDNFNNNSNLPDRSTYRKYHLLLVKPILKLLELL